MKNRIVSLALAVLMLLGFAVAPISALAADGVIIKLHYNRPDGNYADWDVWMWAEGEGGIAVPLKEENGEMVATYEVATGRNNIGFIVRQGGDSWSAKDWGEDQFIDVSEVTSGTVHIYVESGVPGYTKELGDDAATGVKLTRAEYSEARGLIVRMSGDPQGDMTKILTLKTADGTVVPIVSVTKDDAGNFKLELAEKPDLRITYYIIFEGMELGSLKQIGLNRENVFNDDWLNSFFFETVLGNLAVLEDEELEAMIDDYEVQSAGELALIFCEENNAVVWLSKWFGYHDLVVIAESEDGLDKTKLADVVSRYKWLIG